MNEITIESLEDFITQVKEYEGEYTVYRGVNHADYDAIAQGDKLSIKGLASALKAGTPPIIVRNDPQNKEIPVTYDMSERDRQIVIAGGKLYFVSK